MPTLLRNAYLSLRTREGRDGQGLIITGLRL
jgi:hypothetical protein